jgi:uncharacterized repeat protein (TIGR03803 family)
MSTPFALNPTGPRLLLVAVLALLVVTSQPAHAQTESVLYSFCSMPDCSDGFGPNGNLTLDAQDNVYGATQYGGADQNGTVFKVTASGAETVLHSFLSGPGSSPEGSLIWDGKGNLYGTTIGNGYVGLLGQHFFGAVFELEPHHFKFLYRFLEKDQQYGAKPTPGLVRDAQGNLYGTTQYGGANGCATGYGCGTVFKVTPDKTETVLHSFSGGADGEQPFGGLVVDSERNLYGTTEFGGTGTGCEESSGCGTVFKVTPSGTETVLYSFAGGDDGARPIAGLVMDGQGNLYGTTAFGGTGCGGDSGCGTVFKVTPSGAETVLYNFAGGTDASGPWSSLVLDGPGNLYGTSYYGGGSGCTGNAGCGTVFKVTSGGMETVLYRFTGGTDGARPYGGLVLDAQGNLYGTTYEGGVGECYDGLPGCGVLFKVSP